MSPRCKKPRQCSCPFLGNTDEVYKPAGTPLKELERVILDHDEMEAMYLCDSENLTQEEAGTRMGVSRGTVQRMLAEARRKIIEAVVLGKALCITNAPQKGEQSTRK